MVVGVAAATGAVVVTGTLAIACCGSYRCCSTSEVLSTMVQHGRLMSGHCTYFRHSRASLFSHIFFYGSATLFSRHSQQAELHSSLICKHCAYYKHSRAPVP